MHITRSGGCQVVMQVVNLFVQNSEFDTRRNLSFCGLHASRKRHYIINPSKKIIHPQQPDRRAEAGRLPINRGLMHVLSGGNGGLRIRWTHN
jgi:hypothetical protein